MMSLTTPPYVLLHPKQKTSQQNDGTDNQTHRVIVGGFVNLDLRLF